MLPHGTESRMSDGDDAGDCPEVCGCQSPESECVPNLLRCLQSLPGVSALIVLRLSKSSLRVLANDMLAASAACAANQAVNTVVNDAATAGVSAAANTGASSTDSRLRRGLLHTLGHRHPAQHGPLSAQKRPHCSLNVTGHAHHVHLTECRARPRFHESRRSTPLPRDLHRRPARGPGGAPTAPLHSPHSGGRPTRPCLPWGQPCSAERAVLPIRVRAPASG